MKNFLLSVGLTLMFFVGYGQASFQIQNDHGTDITGTVLNFAGPNAPTDPWFKHEIDVVVKNTTGASIDAKVKRIETTSLAGTFNYFCFGVCYGQMAAGANYIFPDVTDPESLDYLSVGAGASSTVNVYLVPNAAVGSAAYRYIVYDGSNPNDSAYVDIVYDITPSNGLNEMGNLDVALYPNPCNDRAVLTLEGEFAGNDLEVHVLNILGKKQLSFTNVVSPNTMTINTSNLSEGVYFVSVRQGTNSIRTSRLVVKH
jgi:hypothetical protein